VEDVSRAKAMVQDTARLQEMRPEIIGGSLAVAADGSFVETVYFSDEQSARQGESVPPPPEVQEELAYLMDGAAFYDLRDPWFESA
jgi:hypothetical protein